MVLNLDAIGSRTLTVIYYLLAIIAGMGLCASIVCHLMAWLHVQPQGGKSVFVLHVGFLVLWFPLVICANRTMPKGGPNNTEHLFAELPKWVPVAIKILFVYALLNFVYFIFSTRHYPKNGVPFSLQLRGFSGHWMMFYGAAAAGFVALG